MIFFLLPNASDSCLWSFVAPRVWLNASMKALITPMPAIMSLTGNSKGTPMAALQAQAWRSAFHGAQRLCSKSNLISPGHLCHLVPQQTWIHSVDSPRVTQVIAIGGIHRWYRWGWWRCPEKRGVQGCKVCVPTRKTRQKTRKVGGWARHDGEPQRAVD